MILQAQISSSRAIAIIGLFSALYIVTSGLASFISQLGYPEHFLRGILMTAVILRTGKKWSATSMGLVSGLVFALIVPSPAPYLLPSTFVSGLVFDIVLLLGASYSESARSRSRLVIGAAVSGLAESIVALGILTYATPGFFGQTAQALTIAWSTDIVLNIILSSVGAVLAFRFLSPKKRTMQSQGVMNT
ncbi:MAG: hypothetical protein OK439_03235 [Thaumarchaeota archaeon]|nr:hypothetical protein [Nitrososphaerota archaeon]